MAQKNLTGTSFIQRTAFSLNQGYTALASNLIALSAIKKILTKLNAPWLAVVLKILLFITVIFYTLYTLKAVKQETQDTHRYITHPKVGDIYFLDYRLLVDELRPNQRLRIAKLVDITGDVLTFRYSNLFYMSQHAMEQSIRYSQLRYTKYFEPKRYNFSHDTVKSMADQEAIFMVKRPIRDQLFGSFVTSTSLKNVVSKLPGSKENLQGLEWLKALQPENNLQLAFQSFEQSAKLNFPPGQVNLAQMYLTGDYVTKDLTLALYWLNQAALQSHKPAILKYVIVCQQVTECSEVAFYKSLQAAGVGIKVRALSDKVSLEPSK